MLSRAQLALTKLSRTDDALELPAHAQAGTAAASHSRRRSAFAGIVLAAALVGVLAGCTAPDTDDAKPSPTGSPSPEASESAPPSVTEITDTPGSGENLVGALADSAVSTCELEGDAWNVAGTVTNPTEDAADYRIYVSLLTADGGTRALQQVDVVGVDAAATEEWSATVAVADEGLSCVLRVERYAA